MTDELSAARRLAERIRFSGDWEISKSAGCSVATERVRRSLLRNELRISEAVTPALADALAQVYRRLHVPPGLVEAFVYPSPEIQAGCISDGSDRCVLRFSSSLLDILDEKEVQFVVGHELGHFLLQHGTIDDSVHGADGMILRRAREVSVDRVGLLACMSMNVAVRALMKTVSGLNSRHLRFDVAAFVAQLDSLSEDDLQKSASQSHPSILVRCRALLWFSLNDFVTRGEEHYSPAQFARINRLVESDLRRFVDGPVHSEIARVRADVLLWAMVHTAIQCGSFRKDDQDVIAARFGIEVVDGIKRMLTDTPSSEVEPTIFGRLRDARRQLEELIPARIDTEIAAVHGEVAAALRGR